MRRKSIALLSIGLSALATFLLGPTSSAIARSDGQIRGSRQALDVLDRLANSPLRNHQILSRILGAELFRTFNSDFEMFNSANITLDDAAIISVRYGVPTEDLDHYAPVLTINFAGTCLTRANVIGRFDALEAIAPDAHDPDQTLPWVIRLRDKKISFRFDESERRCLRTATFEVKPSRFNL